MKYLNDNQLKKFRSALSRGRLRDQTAMELTLYLGLRVSELVDIKRRDVNVDSKQITIYGKKGGRERSYSDIEQSLWSKFYRFYKKTTADDDRIFPISDQAAKNIFKKYAAIANLPADLSIHSLRHTIAILMARRGDSPIKIMLWLRHRSITSTQVYFEQVSFERDSEHMNELFLQTK